MVEALWQERPLDTTQSQMRTWKTNLDNVQIEKHDDRRTNFVLETVHFKAHPFEYNFGAGCVGNLLENCGDLCGVQSI